MFRAFLSRDVIASVLLIWALILPASLAVYFLVPPDIASWIYFAFFVLGVAISVLANLAQIQSAFGMKKSDELPSPTQPVVLNVQNSTIHLYITSEGLVASGIVVASNIQQEVAGVIARLEQETENLRQLQSSTHSVTAEYDDLQEEIAVLRSQNFDRLVRLADSYIRHSDWSNAVVALNEMLTLGSIPEAYGLLGIAHAHLGDWQEAAKALDMATELQPHEPINWYNRGVTRDRSHIYSLDEIIKDYSVAIVLNPNDFRSLTNRGIAYGRKGELNAALADFDQAIEIEANSEIPFINRSRAKTLLRDFDGAFADSETALVLNPLSAEAYYVRSRIYIARRDLAMAMADIEVAIESDSTFADAYNVRGSIYGLRGEPDIALQDFEHAESIEPGRASTKVNIGVIHVLRGQFVAALERFDDVLRSEPDHFEALVNRSQALLGLGRTVEALQCCSRAIELNPRNPEGYISRAEVYRRIDDLQAALRDCEASLAIDRNYFQAHAIRGYVKFREHDLPAALDSFNAAINLNPHFADAYTQRAGVRSLMDDWDGAFQDYETAISIDADSPMPYFYRQYGYARWGRFRDAIADLDKVIDSSRNPSEAFLSEAFACRARWKANVGDVEGSVQDLTEAIRLNPGEPENYLHRGEMRDELRDFKGSAQDYDMYLELKNRG